MTSPPNPALAHSDQVRDRCQEALVLLNQVLDANPHGSVIADPIATRVHLLLAEHYVNAALFALARLIP
jgi:hypothetical protein